MPMDFKGDNATESHQLTHSASDAIGLGDKPAPNPQKRRKKSEALKRQLTEQSNPHIKGELDTARQIVDEASDIIAHVYVSMPDLIEIETSAKIEARLPQIEADNKRRREASQAATNESLQRSKDLARDFLAEYGIDL